MRIVDYFWVVVISCVALTGCGDEGADSQEDSPEGPNVLFLAVDDMNDWAGFLDGHAGMDIKTPNIDRFAESSLAFTNAHTAAPACAPSRTALLTGVHPANIGVDNIPWGDGPQWRELEALQDVETLEEFFKNRGYKTLGGGKIYHSQAPPWSPTSQVEPENWDFYYPSPYIQHPHQIRPPDSVIFPDHLDNETRRDFGGEWWTWGPIPAPDEKMADYHVAEWASYELGQEHDQPFFLAAGTWKPHDPWEVPQKYFDMYPLDEIELPEHKKNDLNDAFDHGRRNIHEWVLRNNQWDNIVQAYAAAITFADAMIGRVLDTLENSPHADNTIVVLWSDHGMHMGEKENFEKFTLWERSTKVPLILNIPKGTEGVPEGTEPGSRYTHPVSLMDIYPTLAEAAGFEIPSHVDGTSLVPMVKDQDIQRGPVVSSYNFSWGRRNESVNGHAVRSENYRYIYYPRVGLEELYDHRSDPNEWNNIAYRDENQEAVEQHRKILRKRFPELDLTWEEGVPDGFELTDDGSIRKTEFTPLSEVTSTD